MAEKKPYKLQLKCIKVGILPLQSELVKNRAVLFCYVVVGKEIYIFFLYEHYDFQIDKHRW